MIEHCCFIDLTQFLLARLDEEDTLHTLDPEQDGARVRAGAEARAKRRVVVEAQQLLSSADLPAGHPLRELARDVLRILASPYSRHDGFRAEWAHQ